MNCMKIVDTIIFIMALVAVMLIFVCSETDRRNLNAAYNSSKERMSANLNAEVVLDGDTLTATSYRLMSNTYILSDGREVGAKLVERNQKQ